MPVFQNADMLVPVVEPLRRQGKVLVTTNGCFDLLHIGHVRYLQEARKLGDFLAVGINTDDSVRAIKGSSRPIHPQDARAEVVAALRCVDAVFFFGESDPVLFIKKLRPQIHVKGGDYTLDRIVERTAVEESGGKVVLLPLVPGFSTTIALQRIRQE